MANREAKEGILCSQLEVDIDIKSAVKQSVHQTVVEQGVWGDGTK